MTLPYSSTIDASSINTELTKASTATITLNDTDVRTLFKVPTSTISFSDAYGKRFAALTTGFACGGFTPPATIRNSRTRFPLAYDINGITQPSTLYSTRRYSAGISGPNYGYSAGGSSPPTTAIATIEKFPFATADTTNGTLVGSLTSTREAPAGQNSSIAGYASGAYQSIAPVAMTNIDMFPFATDANSTNVGSLSTGRYQAAGQSSSTHGYTTGGGNASSVQVATMDRFPFAANGNAVSVGSLTAIREGVRGQSSPTYGYASGGFNTTGGTVVTSSVIDKFPFAVASANATSVGTLVYSRYAGAACSSTTYGFLAGGIRSTPPVVTTNTIERFSFTTDGNAVSTRTLSISAFGMAGQSG